MAQRAFVRDETVASVALFVAIAGSAGLFFRNPAYLTLGPAIGLAAGLCGKRWVSGVEIGGVSALAGGLLGGLVSRPSPGAIMTWLPDVLMGALIAAVLGGLIAAALENSERLRPLITGVALAAIAGVMCLSAIALASLPASDGLSTVQLLAKTPAYSAQMNDSDLYVIWAAELRAGKSYYPMVVDSFERANAARPDAPLPYKSPLSYRLPTLYALLGALPPNGISYVLAMMAICALGVIAAYLLAAEFVPPTVAIAGSILVAGLFSGYGSYSLLDTESWAGVLGLAAVAAFVLSRRHPSRALAWQIASVVLALAAAAFREIALPFLALGLVATLVDAELRAMRAWVSWAIGLALGAAIIAAHWMAAAAAYAHAGSRVIESSWFSPNGAGLVGAVAESAIHVWVQPAVVWVLLALGIVGAIAVAGDAGTRVMLAGVALGGPFVLLFVHPPGETNYGAAPGYWGALVIPTTLACVPLAFALVQRLKPGRTAAD